jgi:hypothetical protein
LGKFSHIGLSFALGSNIGNNPICGVAFCHGESSVLNLAICFENSSGHPDQSFENGT